MHPVNNVIPRQVESEKKFFRGQEISGKTLGVIGLGNIGAQVAENALQLGMNVIGYDPKLSVDAAWRLPSEIRPAEVRSRTECQTISDTCAYNHHTRVGFGLSDRPVGLHHLACALYQGCHTPHHRGGRDRRTQEERTRHQLRQSGARGLSGLARPV